MLYPSRVAVASDGTVYIADQYAHTVWVFNGDSSQLLYQFGSRGSAPGQFNFPRGIALDASSPQRLFVMDSGNERVQVFAVSAASATLLYAFGSNGQGLGQFHGENTRGLAIDTTDGWVFVSDIGANTVHKFDLAGNWLQNIGHLDRSTFPSPPGAFTQGGREVTVTTGTDSRPQLWVGDMANFRVEAFDATTGSVLFVAPAPPALPPVGDFNGPRGVTADSSGNLYVADTHNFRLEKFDPTGQFVWAVGNRGAAINSDSFAYTRNMAADPSQPYFYLADTYNNAIDKYDSNGVRLWQIAGLGSATGKYRNP
jgi:DNA-binding beta-propeller fold protein YncE